MKNYINLCFCLFVFAGFGQKTLQSYTLELGETKIIIHATAESVDRLHFTLKNELGNVYTPKSDYRENYGIILNDENHIAFKVFPFTETELAAKLSKAIELVNTIEKELNDSKENLTVDKENYRNIFQFFNALVITAFQYDTEPVAGVLKYQLKDIVISKNTLQGQVSTQDYFNRQAKILRRHVYGKSPDISKNDFIKWIVGEEKNSESHIKENIEQETGSNKLVGDSPEVQNVTTQVEMQSEGPPSENDTQDETVELDSDKNAGSIPKEIDAASSKNKVESKTYLKEFENYKNLLDRKFGNGKSKFKEYAVRRLAEIYNEWKFGEGLKNIKTGYQQLLDNIQTADNQLSKLKVRKEELIVTKEGIKIPVNGIENEINNLTNKRNELEVNIKQLEDSLNVQKNKIETLAEKNEEDAIDSIINKAQDNFERKQSLLRDYLDTLENHLETNKESISKKENELKEAKEENKKNIKELDSDIQKKNDDIQKKENEIEEFQSKINKLIFNNKETLSNIPLWNFKVAKLEIDINDGFIEHLTATGHLTTPLHKELTADSILIKLYEEDAMKGVLSQTKGKPIKFENEFPIGFSSRADYVDMYDYKLYHFEGGDKVYSMQLSDELITYVQRHENDRLNFSPRDQVVRLPLNDKLLDGEVELKKEISKKILSAKVYTDFIGFDEGEENSPLQFEVDKEIPIWTKRFNFGLGRSSNYGFLNYANFNLTWAKVTQEDGKLQVSKDNIFVNNQPEPINYVTYLDVVSHENLSVGVDLNLFSLDFPLTKTRFNINAGIHYGRVKIVDEQVVDDANNDSAPATVITQDTDTNLIRFYPDFMVWVRPDERFGGYLRFRPFRLVVPNTIEDDLYVLSSEKKFLESKELAKEWMQRYEFSAFFKPSVGSDNKFFFRYRYTNSSSWEYNGYSEVQLGYLIYLKF